MFSTLVKQRPLVATPGSYNHLVKNGSKCENSNSTLFSFLHKYEVQAKKCHGNEQTKNVLHVSFLCDFITNIIHSKSAKGRSIIKSVFTEDKNSLQVPGFKLHKEGYDFFGGDGHNKLSRALPPFVIWNKENS